MRSTNIIYWIAAISLIGCTSSCVNAPRRVTQFFSAGGVSTVVVRASQIESATVTVSHTKNSIGISGVPTGGAKGYHPSDPSWRETPAAQWGLDFVAQAFGKTLVISTKNEIRYIHHYYVLGSLRIDVPVGIEVVRLKRELSGSGEPDLSQP